MVRSQHSRASSLAPGAAKHKASLQHRKPSYKVVLEEVTEKKKKLFTQVSLECKKFGVSIIELVSILSSLFSTLLPREDIHSFRLETPS